MGLSHSNPHHRAKYQPVKIFHDGSNSTAHVSDDDSIECLQLSLYDPDRDVKEKGVLPWWKNLLSRLSRSRNSPTEINEENSLNSDADTALSLTPPPLYFTNNDYVHAQTKSIRLGLEKCECYTQGASDWGDSSSHMHGANGPIQTENENSTLIRNSPSPARPYVEAKQECIFVSDGISHPEPEVISIAEAEVMYTKATWRMYERITSSRTAAAITNEQFSIQNSLPPSDGDIAFPPVGGKCSCGYMVSEEILQDDQSTALSSSIDRHQICFEMDQD